MTPEQWSWWEKAGAGLAVLAMVAMIAQMVIATVRAGW